jgi:hypothetical protein
MLYGPYLWCHITGENYSDYGIRWHIDGKALRLVLFFLIATLVPLTVVAMLWPGQSLPRTVSVNTAVALTVSGTVAAVVEETFFRGWIFTIVRRRLGPGTTIIIIALLFALSHLFLKVHWLRIATFFPGLVMGYLRERTENIVPGMIYHGIGNIWSIWFFPGM